MNFTVKETDDKCFVLAKHQALYFDKNGSGTAFCSKLSELPSALVSVFVNDCVCAEGLERIFSDQ